MPSPSTSLTRLCSTSYSACKTGETNIDLLEGRPSKQTSGQISKALPSPSSSEDITSPIFFWKLEETPYGCFCQWYPSRFTHPLLSFTIHTHPKQPYAVSPTSKPPTTPITFTSCEQFMMAHKAHLFSPDDRTIYNRIMSSTSPQEQKALGQRVPNFDEDIWNSHRLVIVKWGNYLKFSQNEKLKALLLGTGERELVEASPRDRIWGVGFEAKNAEENRERWGSNLLGKALMAARERIRRKEEEEKVKGKEEKVKGKKERDGKGE
ncbi:hypothetical protein EV426DRAFT_566313 [Tirmania nivea]|nr:hypothetical protein EV426DRAFT_566313 [Tirmania nivea]